MKKDVKWLHWLYARLGYLISYLGNHASANNNQNLERQGKIKERFLTTE